MEFENSSVLSSLLNCGLDNKAQKIAFKRFKIIHDFNMHTNVVMYNILT